MKATIPAFACLVTASGCAADVSLVDDFESDEVAATTSIFKGTPTCTR